MTIRKTRGRPRLATRLLAGGALAAVLATGYLPSLSVATPGGSLNLFGATSAQAAPYRVGYSVTYQGNTKTVGTLDVRPGSNGHRVICIDSNLGDPPSLGAGSPVTDAQLAYLVSKYIDQTSDNVTGAALAEIVKRSYDGYPTVRDAVWAAFHAQRPTEAAAADARINALIAEAASAAGPYTVAPVINSSNPTNTSGVATNLGAQSGNGTWLAGYSTTVRLIDSNGNPASNVVFDATGTNTWTGTTGSVTGNLAWHVTGAGNFKVEQTVTGLPGETMMLYLPPAPGDQRMITGAFTTTSAYGKDPVDTAPILKPTLSSQVGNGLYKLGEKPGDTVRISNGAPGATTTVTVKWYGPFATQPAESATPPAGAPLFDTMTQSVTLDSNGAAGVGLVSTKAITAPGYYVAVESTSADPNSGMEAADSTFGRDSETTTAPDPTVTTTISKQRALVGDTLSDTADVQGVLPKTGVTYTLTGSLLGPVKPVSGACTTVDWTGAPVAATIPATSVTGSGPISGLGSHVVAVSGCYTYTETLTVADNGTVRITVVHPAGDVSQTALVEAQPTITSKMANTVYVAGQNLVDNVSVTKGAAGAPANITVTWYGPLATQPTAEAPTAPADAPVFDTATGTGTIAADGTATIKVTSTKTVTAPGYYVAVETVAAQPDFAMLSATGTYGRSVESAITVNPTVLTKTNYQVVYPGADLADTATIGGIIPMAGVTYTLTGSLLGPVAPAADGTCKGVDWTNAAVAAPIPAMVVDKDGDIADLGPFKVTEVGCYTYTETLTVTEGDVTRVVIEHKPGQELQTTTVTTPSISTQTSQQLALPGSNIIDTIKVANPAGYTGTMTATLWGPFATPTPGAECSTITDTMWRDAITSKAINALATEDIAIVAGTDTYTTKPVTVTALGCYTWYEKAVFDKPFSYETETPYGVDTETTMVINPAITTQAKFDTDRVGATFTDDIFLTGTNNQPGTITGYVLWLPAPANLSCAGLDWTNATKVADITPIKTTADGTYTSNGIKIAKAGCSTFVESWTADKDNRVVTNTKPGEATETALFKRFIATGFGAFDTIATPEIVTGAALMVAALLALGTYGATRRRRAAVTD